MGNRISTCSFENRGLRHLQNISISGRRESNAEFVWFFVVNLVIKIALKSLLDSCNYMSWLLKWFSLLKYGLKSRKRYTLRLLLIHLCLVVWEWIACKRSFLHRTERKTELWISLVELVLKIVFLNLFNAKYRLRYLEILIFAGYLYYVFFSD